MRILDRYLLRSFLESYAIVFFAFMGIYVVLDFFANYDAFEEVEANVLSVVLRYYVFSMPLIFWQLAPFLTLIAGMFCIARMAKANELTPIKASGVSLYRTLMPMFMMAGLVVLAMVGVKEGLVPALAQEIAEVQRLRRGKAEKKYGLDLPDGRGRHWEITNYYPADRELRKVQVYSDDRDLLELKPAIVEWVEEIERTRGSEVTKMRVTAEEAHFDADLPGVVMRLPKVHLTMADQRRFVSRELWDNLPIVTDMSPAKLELRHHELVLARIDDLADAWRRNPHDMNLRVKMHERLVFPLMNFVLLLLGLPFVIRHRVRSGFLGVSIATVICAIYYAAHFSVQTLGATGVVPPVVAMWMPLIVFGSVGICLFDTLET